MHRTRHYIVLTYNMLQFEKADRYLYGDKLGITKALEQYETLRARNGLDQ